jgi:hypothetical protein
MRVIESASSGESYYSIVGAVRRSGVYRDEERSISLGRLVRAAGGTTELASSHLLVVKNGGRPVRIFAREPEQAQDLLFAGDTVIVVPDTTASRSGANVSRPKTVPVACIGLADRPVVLPLAPDIRTREELITRLQQPRSLANHVRLLDPHGRASTNQLVSGTVLVFDGRYVDRTALASTEAFPPAVPLNEPASGTRPAVESETKSPAEPHPNVTRHHGDRESSNTTSTAPPAAPRTLVAPGIAASTALTRNDAPPDEQPPTVEELFEEQTSDRSSSKRQTGLPDEAPVPPESQREARSFRSEPAADEEPPALTDADTSPADAETTSIGPPDNDPGLTVEDAATLPATRRTGSSNLLVLGAILLLIAAGAGISVLWARRYPEIDEEPGQAGREEKSDDEHPITAGDETANPADSLDDEPAAASPASVPTDTSESPMGDHSEESGDETVPASRPVSATAEAGVPSRLINLLDQSLPIIEESPSLPENLVLHGEAVGHRRIILHEAHPALMGMHFHKTAAPDPQVVASADGASESAAGGGFGATAPGFFERQSGSSRPTPHGAAGESLRVNRVPEEALRQQLRAVFATGRPRPETEPSPGETTTSASPSGAPAASDTSRTDVSVDQRELDEYDRVLPEEESSKNSNQDDAHASPASQETGALDRALQRLAGEKRS